MVGVIVLVEVSLRQAVIHGCPLLPGPQEGYAFDPAGEVFVQSFGFSVVNCSLHCVKDFPRQDEGEFKDPRVNLVFCGPFENEGGFLLVFVKDFLVVTEDSLFALDSLKGEGFDLGLP